MALTIDDVITPASEDDYFAKILAAATALGLKTTAWQSGGITRTILRIVAKLEAGRDVLISAAASGGFLKLAAAATPDPSIKLADGTFPPSGTGWLDICADSGFDVQRIGPSYAFGSMVITNSSGSNYGPFAVGTYHLANPSSKKTYHNTASLTIAASGNTTASFAADEAGSDSTSAASSITQTVTSLVGVTINPGSQTGTLTGSNAESNDALIDRCLNKLSALGLKLGPTGAYKYFATTATLDSSAGGGGIVLAGGPITRVRVAPDTANGIVTVTLANSSGAPSGPDVAAIDTYLHNVAVPDGITELTQAASESVVNATVNVWVPSAYVSAVSSLVQTSVANYINGLPIGGIPYDAIGGLGVPLDAVIDAAFNAASYISQATVLLNGVAANVALAGTEVAKAGTVTVVAHGT